MLTAEREVKAELLRMHHEVDSITVDLRQRPLVARQTTDEKVQSSYVIGFTSSRGGAPRPVRNQIQLCRVTCRSCARNGSARTSDFFAPNTASESR